jgi:hypothetical protein
MRNIVPRIRERLRLPELDDAANLRWCRIVSTLIGGLIITFALLLVTLGQVQLFDMFLLIGSVIGVPMSLPLIWGLVLRRVPGWSYFAIFLAGVLPSAFSLIGPKVVEMEPWTIQQRSLWVMLFGSAAALICWCFRNHASAEFRKREIAFFERMSTPVNFETETGESNDRVQALLVGRVLTGVGGLIALFLFVPNSLPDRGIILALSGFVAGMGLLLLRSARIEEGKGE